MRDAERQASARRRWAAARLALAALCVAAAAALPAAAQAETRFAEPGEGGADPTCPQADPCDIVEAVNEADEGDEVVVLPGTYSVSTLLSISEVNMLVRGLDGLPTPRIETTGFTGFSVGNTQATVRNLAIVHSGGGRALILLEPPNGSSPSARAKRARSPSPACR